MVVPFWHLLEQQVVLSLLPWVQLEDLFSHLLEQEVLYIKNIKEDLQEMKLLIYES